MLTTGKTFSVLLINEIAFVLDRNYSLKLIERSIQK